MKQSRYSLFIHNVVQDAFLFIFILFVLTVYRIAFLALFKDALTPQTTWHSIFLTLWYGLRIGLKTAGACVLPAFVLGTLLQVIWPKWNGMKLRFWWACAVLLILSLLFQLRIPYYQEFHQAFSPFMFNTFHDDVGAIVSTSIDQYHAVWRTLAGLICAFIWCWLCRKWLTSGFTRRIAQLFTSVKRPWLAVTCFCIFLVPFAVFVRKGGAFTFNQSIYWKNAARMDQHLLNEAILDDIQAFYRARWMYKRLRKAAAAVDVQSVRQAAARLTGQEAYTANDLLPLLSRKSSGFMGEKPKHVFLIVAETYMLWPLLDEYAQYPLANGMRRLLKRPDAALFKHFLPNSSGTMSGLSVITLGLPDLDLNAQVRPTAQQPYEMALPVQMRQHGYKTRFFYGGFPSWDDVGSFMNNQQFEESYYEPNFGGKASVWGVPDRDFLQGIPNFIGPEASFNLILTSSNHPPYRVDTSREPELPTVQDFEKMIEGMPDKSLVAARMWHFAYADKYLAEFIEHMLNQEPNSLFIIVGDHADRWTLTTSPSDYERYAVPLIVIGPQLKQEQLDLSAPGAHMDLASTVLEMVLEKDTPYYALGHNILRQQHEIPVGVGTYFWITSTDIARIAADNSQLLPGVSKGLSEEEKSKVRQYANDIHTIAGWRILKGISLQEEAAQ